MASVRITNTCHVRGKLCRKGVAVELDDEAAASVVASHCGELIAAPGSGDAVEPAPVPRTAVDATAATTRKAVKLGG